MLNHSKPLRHRHGLSTAGFRLTYRSGSVVSADGGRLVCSNHHAEFSVEDGGALSGPVSPGCGLTPVPVHVDADGSLIIGD